MIGPRRGWTAAPRQLAAGAAVAAVVQAGAAGVLALLGMARFASSGVTARPGDLLREGLALGVVSGAQEVVFRGLLLRALAPLGAWPAAVLSGAAFVALHASHPGETPAGLAGLFVFALVTAAAVRRTGALWWAIGFHGAWNIVQDVVLGLPDSGLAPSPGLFVGRLDGPAWLTGGAAGPEGGAPAIALMAVTLTALLGLRGSVAAPRSDTTPHRA